MLHRPIFTEKYLNSKLKGFSLDTIQNLEEKRKILYRWIKSINSGRIAKTKEKSIQGDFLNYIFGDILDYDYSDPKSWNLSKEHTLMNGKMADGALGYFRMKGDQVESDVRAVIELKDANTDLDKPQNRKDDKRSPVEQAFSYASKAGGNCNWVIVSNFKEIRLYHSSDQGRYELFNLPNLPENNNLLRFFLLLKKDHLIAEKGDSFVDRLHKERQEEEQKITKDFYDTYKEKRLLLFRHLKDKNPETDELLVFNKTQKLIDRLIFVFFCEDIGLLPPYTIQQIRDIVSNSFDMSNTKVWRQLKGLFHSINVGNTKQNINKFNGGLFEKDDTLDNLVLEDETLLDVLKLADYDFSSDLNVNILGHIFEQSISDIEEIKADIKGEPYDRKSGKRKKEGIFYTPEYITRYIVKEAVGGWLEDRRQELGYYDLPELQEEDYNSIKTTKKKGKLRASANVKKHVAFWEQYREKLSNIKVLDPACGSGAFLNQVFDYLYAEGQKVNRELSRLKGGLYTVFDLDKHILTNNIFGVDLNRESVEITKLSLWLKTASKQKQLTALDKNIRCGNSLIDDPEVAGDEALNWEENFPEIMENGGFDVVVGNPPYIQSRSLSNFEKEYIYKHYETAQYQINTYGIFVEKFISLLKKRAYYGIIIPNYWLSTQSGKNLRKKVFIDNYAMEVINTYKVFDSATVDTLILTGQKEAHPDKETSFFSISSDYKTVDERLNAINLQLWDYAEKRKFKSRDENTLMSFNKELKLSGNSTLKEYFSIYQGMKPYEKGKGDPAQTREMMKNKAYHSQTKIDESYLPLLGAKHIKRYSLKPFNEYIKYGKNLAAPRNYEIFKRERILINRIISKDKIDGVLLTETYINNTDVFNLIPNRNNPISTKVLYAIILSKLCATYFKKANVNLNRNAYPKINVNTLEEFPIPEITQDIQKRIEDKVDSMHTITADINNKKNKFIELVKDNLEITRVSKKLESFYDYDFKSFLEELKKQKVKLSLSDQNEWKDFFEKTNLEINHLKTERDQTDREIDRMVYDLYGLTGEEIKLIENEK